MKTKILSVWLLAAALAGAAPGACWAQAPAGTKPPAPAHAAPRPDDIEPGVDTSADQHPGQVRDNTPGSSAAAAAPAAPAGDPAPGDKPARKAGAKGGKAGAKPADPAGDKSGKPTDKATGKTLDHMDLDRTQITGNRELPKVMVIVPWKHSDLGDLGKPMNSLVNEVLQPVDRDVFERQTRYYEALKPDAAAPAAR